MIEQGLKAEAQKLVAHIQSLGSGFKILKAQPANHIGAIIADAVLQVGHRWKTHVEKRVKRIESNYPGAATLSGLSKLLATEGAQKLLDWNGKDEQTRFCQTIGFFSNERVDGVTIDTVSQLSKWLASEDNRDRLLTKSLRSDKAGIPKIADKTADYYRVMVGLPDAVAVDSLIRAFLKDAGVRGGQYHRARAIVQLAAQMLSTIRNTSIRPIDLDQSIWKFQSEREREGEKALFANHKGACGENEVADKEGRMNVRAGIIIDADIVDPSQCVLKKGRARGLLRLEISITNLEVGKLTSAYPSYYGILLSPRSYSGLPRKNSATVPLTLVFGHEEYQANLKKPEKRKGAWIPNGPVYDKSGSDVKLAGALCHAGFPVKHWTSTQTTLRLPKPKPIRVQPVKFAVTDGTWRHLQLGGLPPYGGALSPKPDE